MSGVGSGRASSLHRGVVDDRRVTRGPMLWGCETRRRAVPVLAPQPESESDPPTGNFPGKADPGIGYSRHITRLLRFVKKRGAFRQDTMHRCMTPTGIRAARARPPRRHRVLSALLRHALRFDGEASLIALRSSLEHSLARSAEGRGVHRSRAIDSRGHVRAAAPRRASAALVTRCERTAGTAPRRSGLAT